MNISSLPVQIECSSLEFLMTAGRFEQFYISRVQDFCVSEEREVSMNGKEGDEVQM
jgi:hypothetical protein